MKKYKNYRGAGCWPETAERPLRRCHRPRQTAAAGAGRLLPLRRDLQTQSNRVTHSSGPRKGQ